MTIEPIVEPDDPGDYCCITVVWDRDRQCPVFNIGEMDPWTAVAILYQVADHLGSRLVEPMSWDELGTDPNEPEDQQEVIE